MSTKKQDGLDAAVQVEIEGEGYADVLAHWDEWMAAHPSTKFEPKSVFTLVQLFKYDILRLAVGVSALERLTRPMTTRELYKMLVDEFTTARYCVMFVQALERKHVVVNHRYPVRRVARVCYHPHHRATIAAHLDGLFSSP